MVCVGKALLTPKNLSGRPYTEDVSVYFVLAIWWCGSSVFMFVVLNISFIL